jgi:hypothetical protein
MVGTVKESERLAAVGFLLPKTPSSLLRNSA